MQIKPTMIPPHTSQNGHHQKKSMKNKCCREYREKTTLLHSWWESKLVQQLWKTVWCLLKKTKYRTTI